MNKLVIIVLLSMLCGISLAQDRAELEDRKQKTQQDIELTNKLLEETQSNKESSYNDVLIIERRIKLREKLIRDINNEINYLEDKIEDNNEIISSLENDLKKIKEEYAKMIYYHFKNKEINNRLMYVLASESFDQAYKRIKYLQQYSEFRKKQVRLIDAVQKTLYNEIINIQQEIENKEQLSEDKNAETIKLENEKIQKQKYLAQLSTKEDELKKKLEQQKRIAERLENEMLRLIEEETDAMSMEERLTPEERIIDNNFKSNQGKLPWPTKRGFVIRGFGEHEHPVLKGNVIRNNGIDISTIENAEVQALFEGVVSRVFSYLGANYTVIIRHGSFLSVYQNLKEVYVEAGDKVNTKQLIGKVYTDMEDKTTILHLEIWEEFEKHNPEQWLSTFSSN